MNNRIAIPDTSALLRNVQLIGQLGKNYAKVIVPDVVVRELDNNKDNNQNLSKKAWEVLCAIKNSKVEVVKYDGNPHQKNDLKIISVAEKAAQKHGYGVDIITEDIDYAVYLKGNTSVSALRLREYLQKVSSIADYSKLEDIDELYSQTYPSKCPLSLEEINAYLTDGNTLIISVVRNGRQSIQDKKAKIRWLIKNGADVDKRDSGRRNFPPLSHAIQMNDFEMFCFLLNECRANPNVGSRTPKNMENVRQKNEGNMPLMVAAWDGRDRFVEELLKDGRTSINQQDANGFTALIKAGANGKTRCIQMLLDAGADTKIVDIDGNDYQVHLERFQKYGQLRKNYKRRR